MHHNQNYPFEHAQFLPLRGGRAPALFGHVMDSVVRGLENLENRIPLRQAEMWLFSLRIMSHLIMRQRRETWNRQIKK